MLPLSIATNYYDRTAALYDGRVRIEGCKAHHLLIEAPEMFHRSLGYEEFDVTELSLGGHVVTTARGDAPYVGIPAFPLRMFRHSSVYIRADRGIARPEDLAGRTIGVPEYQQTANVWIRGVLQDEYGVDVRSIKWRSGGLEEAGRKERTPLTLPADIDWTTVPEDQTLSTMLERGEIDAIISPRAPSCFSRKSPSPHVARLFADYPVKELEYFQRTGIFPIMHIVGIRRTLVERHPWVAVSVYKAFLRAKAMIDMRHGTMLPWGADEYDRMRKLLGPDYWSYGLKANRRVIETFARYAQTQGLADRIVAPEELFVPSTLDLSRN